MAPYSKKSMAIKILSKDKQYQLPTISKDNDYYRHVICTFFERMSTFHRKQSKYYMSRSEIMTMYLDGQTV